MSAWCRTVRAAAIVDGSAACGTRVNTFSHSTFKSLFVSREELAAADPRRVPNLDAWGLARRAVLEFCDGRRTLSEIETELRRHHGDLFPGRGEAQAFVVRTLSPDGR